MTDNSSFSPEESLELIQEMIQKAKVNLSHNRFFFLLWGWIAFISILSQYVLKVWLHSPYHYLVWLSTFVGAVVSIWYGRKISGEKKIRSYVENSIVQLWIGMGISFFVITWLFSRIGFQYCYPVYIMMYGLGTFVTGRILEFKPLILGGIGCWILAILTGYLPFDDQMPLGALAIVISYLIPGYMLKQHSVEARKPYYNHV